MSASALALDDVLALLRQRDIQLDLDGDALKVRARRESLTPETRAVLNAHRDALLAHLKAAARPAEEDFALTDVQQAYWVGRGGLDLGGIGCHAYREFRAPDGLDLARLEQAWLAVVARHDMLRAIVTPEGRTRVLPALPHWRLPVLDLRGAADAPQQLAAVREAMSHQVFDPARWPLFDIRATRTDAGLHLHVGMDLLVADAASMLQLYREWSALYADPSAQLPPPRRRFAEFVRGQQDDAEAQARAAAYWAPRLAQLPGPPELPLAADAPAGPARFVRRSRTLAGPQWARLVALAREEGLTPSNLLLAAYADVLAAFSRHQHFLLTLTTFRVPSEFAGVVGDFTSTLLLEVDARGPTFVERARAVQRRLAQDLEHTGWSGVRVARELARREGAAARPVPVVFTSALGHRGAGEGGLPLAWLGETLHAITQTPQVWIDHHVIEDGEQLLCSWDVLEGVLPTPVVDAMFEAHGRLLQALAEPAGAAWQAPLGWHLPPAQAACRARANATQAPLPAGLLHDGFFAAARRDPERIALVSPARSLPYGELAAWAHAVAARVRQAGIGAGELVAVEMHKGWQQVAAVLGIGLAGAAWLPVDRGLPESRRAQLIERGRARLVLTDGEAGEAPVPRVPLASLTPRADPPAGNSATPADLAYVIFTSGSTGEPKGVMMEHRAALNTLADLQRRFAIGADDAVLGLSSLSFDLSVFDIFGVLGAGGRLVLPDADRARDPRHWASLMAQHGVSLWNSVPALAEMLVESGAPPGDHLRLALLSGDWIGLTLPARLRALAPGLRVIGLGGATEAAVWSNWFDIGAPDPSWRSIPYGWPLDNQRYHVLNDVLEPAPDGVAGRLFIAGAGLARGYWDDPVLTARRFFVHPRNGERLYETGDLARYLPDGALEFLGREDTQVKLGGHRVELGEIEACLARHPQVAQAVAYTVGDPRGERRLAIAVVPRDGAPTAGVQADAQAIGAPLPVAPEAAPAPTDSADGLQALRYQASSPGLREGDADTAWVALGPLPGDLGPWRRRRSVRAFSPAPVPLPALAALLAALAGVRGAGEEGLAPKRRYPSGGSLYALQCWVLVAPGRVDGLAGGLYCHHPLRHALEPVAPGALLPTEAQFAVNRPVAQASAFALLLVAPLAAIGAKYGDGAARDLALLEAGYMGQLLMEEAAAQGLGLCPIGAMDTRHLPPALPLDAGHALVHSFFGGLPAGGGDLAAELRAWLAQRLPAYMVSDGITLLDRLPLSANGKVDRARLPQPAAPARAAAAAVAPAPAQGAALELLLRAHFAEVLGLAAVPLDTGLFELGGTSLHVVRLHRALEQALGRPLDILALFRHPSVAALARVLEAG